MSERSHVRAAWQEGLSLELQQGGLHVACNKKDTPRGVFFVSECFYSGYLATDNFVVMTSLAVGITMV